MYAAVRGHGSRLTDLVDLPQQLSAWGTPGNTLTGQPIQFVAPSAKRVVYETYIATTGAVPTRDVWHDAFNALVWFAFPRAKAVLNARQAQEIAQHGVCAQRGAVRDALTLIDENAVLLVTQLPEAIAAWHAHDWVTLFVDLRQAWQHEIQAVVLGHALMERWMQPYKGITAHAWHVPLAPDKFICTACLDAWFARALTHAVELTPPFLRPLPLAGIPGWWPKQDSHGFYTDTGVFRPPRQR